MDQRHDDLDEEVVLPTAFGRRIKQAAEQRRKQEDQGFKQETKRKAAQQADPKFGQFEQHTKGIGLKLLQSMGYKPGEGLGKDKSGIAKPVEPKMRPKGMGMGFGDFTEQARAGKEREPSADAAPVAAAANGKAAAAAAGGAAAGQGKLWKKRNAGQRTQREYRTAEEVLEQAADRPMAAQPILDMRGPQARIITNLEHMDVEEATGQVRHRFQWLNQQT